MRIRTLISASAIALVAASCSQPEPQILSEAPLSTTSTDLASATESTARDVEQGRFIARCATEADGGTPGMTVFTDGTQSVTDHCLSRYYIGVQPAPGALYVPDQDTGTYAPSRDTTEEPAPTQQWTPAQPRTDAGPDTDADPIEKDQDLGGTDRENEVADDNAGEAPSPEATPTTTIPPTEPGETTTPGENTTPVVTEPTDPGETDPTTPGSSDPTPTTTVPTVTETPEQSPPVSETPVSTTAPSGPLGSAGSHGS